MIIPYEEIVQDFDKQMQLIQVGQCLAVSKMRLSEATRSICAEHGLEDDVLSNLAYQCARIAVIGNTMREDGIELEEICRSIWAAEDRLLRTERPDASSRQVSAMDYEECRQVVSDIVQSVLLNKGSHYPLARFNQKRGGYERHSLRVLRINSESGMIVPSDELVDLVWRTSEIDDSLMEHIDAIAWKMKKKLAKGNYDEAIRLAEKIERDLRGQLGIISGYKRQCEEDVLSLNYESVTTYLDQIDQLQLDKSSEFKDLHRILKNRKRDLATFENHSGPDDGDEDAGIDRSREKLEAIDSILLKVMGLQQTIQERANKLRALYLKNSNTVLFTVAPVDMLDWSELEGAIGRSSDVSSIMDLYDIVFQPFMCMRPTAFTSLDAVFAEQKGGEGDSDSELEMCEERVMCSADQERVLKRIRMRERLFESLVLYALDVGSFKLSDFLLAEGLVFSETSYDNVAPSFIQFLLEDGPIPSVPASDTYAAFEDDDSAAQMELVIPEMYSKLGVIPQGKAFTARESGMQIEHAFRRDDDDVVVELPDVWFSLEDEQPDREDRR